MKNDNDIEIDPAVLKQWNERLMQEKDAVYKLGKIIGFGNMMHLASKCWRESLEKNGYPLGGEFVPGPCESLTTQCICVDNKPDGHCNYCCGTRWLTKEVKKILIDNEK